MRFARLAPKSLPKAGYALVLACALATPALSQTLPATPTLADPVGERLRQLEPPLAATTADEQTTTASLNAAIAQHNDAAETRERQQTQAHAATMARYEAERDRAEQRIAQNLSDQPQYQTEQQQHAKARADWAACRAGDRSRCLVTY